MPTLECVSAAALACLAAFLGAWILCSVVLVAAVAFEDRFVLQCEPQVTLIPNSVSIYDVLNSQTNDKHLSCTLILS